ncbi:peptidylprolyl isomerase [Sutterella sp.]|uniref:peptidylprolyl isomerase n=1 Tax=Sutterella sp. TaxID=1981025 RepID=UPI0026DFAFEA|nr:peptidylprolyl isomerase [Sutterella sp.]MDO5531021.1 peptidylprolyl isomerase [Sutterella sp.]
MTKFNLLPALGLSATIAFFAGTAGAATMTDAAGSEQQPTAITAELDRIVAIVNNDVITEHELEQRVHTVAINLRRQQINLPPMELLRAQVLERLISERSILQRARQTGIRVDDQMVNASIEQIARQNNLTVEELRQRLLADGVTFAAFRNEIRDEITSQRLREREVNEKLEINESEIDAFLLEQAGFKGDSATEYHLEHILIPVETAEEEESVHRAADSLAERARNGEDFAQLAAAFSRADDAMTGGDLGWKTLSDMPVALSDILRERPNEKIYVFSDKRAWHVVKVSDKRDGVQAKLGGGPVEQTHARHILMFVSEITPEGDVIRRLNDIRNRVQSGEADFATMARLHSVDSTATRGGDLGWLQPGDTVPEFEQALAGLRPGQISEPVRTPYGYHLIQVVERRTEKEGNPERMRVAARQAIRQKKLAEASYNWERELRDEAYVEIRDPQLKETLGR